jgi:hypothetical protein
LVTLCLATSSNPKTLFSPAMADSYAPETKFPSERVSPSQQKIPKPHWIEPWSVEAKAVGLLVVGRWAFTSPALRLKTEVEAVG